MLLLSSADFFGIKLLKKIFQEHYQSVKQLGSRSEPMFCQSWSGAKQFAMVINRQQKVAASKEELNMNECSYQVGIEA